MTTSTSTANPPIVFILDNVSDYASMAEGLYAGYEVHVLSAEGDALAQMASFLDGRTGIDAIHLVSHGQAGELNLGTVALNLSTLADYGDSLAVIRASLSPDADFLIYGCDVAQGDVGLAFVNALAEATGADVAASDDTTGPVANGGDAELEVQTGSIEAHSLDQSNFQSDLGSDSSLPAGLASAPYTWNGYTFQTRIEGEITTTDPENPLRAGNQWDRYVLDGVADGTVVHVYMGNSSTVDDFIQVSRNGVVITEDDDSGDGTDSYDAFVTWTYQAGDVIHATTYSSDLGTYSLFIGTDNGTVAQPTDIGSGPVPTPTSAPEFTDGYGLLGTLSDTAAVDVFSDISGTLTASDTTPNGLTFSGGGASALGNLVVQGDGQFTFSPIASAINAMAQGESQTLTFSVTVTDDGGLSSSKDVTVNLIGANDAPLVTNATGDLALAEVGGSSGVQVTGSLTGSFGVNDVDAAAPLDETDVVFGLPEGGTDDGGALYAQGEYGTLYLNAVNGDYLFVPDAARIEALAEGQVVTDVYQVSATDALGATGIASFTVTLTGANDAPVISVGTPSAALIEDGGMHDEVVGVDRSVVEMILNDVDGQAEWDLAWLAGQGWVATEGGNALEAVGQYGVAQLWLETGRVTYTLNNAAPATQALAGGQVVSESFQVRVGDGLTTTDGTVSFAITGTDDSPTVVVAQPQSVIVEDGTGSGWTGGDNLTGVLTLVDPDSALADTSSMRFAVDGDTYQDDSGNVFLDGQLGTLFLDTLSGAYQYMPSSRAIDALTDGQVVTDTFTFSVQNVAGVIGTGSFSVVVSGTNDLPVITLEAPTATLVEAGGVMNAEVGHQVAQIGVQMSDAEGAAYLDVAAMAQLGWVLSEDLGHLVMDGQFGSASLSLATGMMVYELANNSTATQALAEGALASESFTVQVADQQGTSTQATAVFSILGADDAAQLVVDVAPVGASYFDGSGQEHPDYNRSGSLRLTDVDTDLASYGNVTYSVADAYVDDGGVYLCIGGFGTLAVDPTTGRFNYVADANATAGIASGVTAYDVFTVGMTTASGFEGSNVFEVQLIGASQVIEV